MNTNENTLKSMSASAAIADKEAKNKGENFLIGLCVVLALFFVFFELTYTKAKVIEEDEPIYEMNYEEDMIPVTIQEEQQPAAPVVNNNVQPEIIQIVEDEVEIKEEKIETSEEVNQSITSGTATGAPTAVAGPPAPVAVVEAPVDDKIYDVVEVNAQFPGGDAACYEWLNKNIKYPAICQEQNIQGRVSVRFVVNTDGTIVDPEIVRSPDDNLSKEALRVIKLMPKWKPARMGNKNVRVRFVLPVNFRLQ